MISIIQHPNEVLRQTAKEVPADFFGSETLNDILKQMANALADTPDGVALACPQIGLSWRIFTVSKKIFADEKNPPTKDLVFINPTLVKLSKKKTALDEGCLSVRFKYGKVKRHDKATILAYDETGEKFSWSGSGLMAQIFQHETDHLDGILFIDKATDVADFPPENQ